MNQYIDLIGGFSSATARRAAQLAALGFLGSLGFVPGRERLIGFFGFIGVAYIIEGAYRIKRPNTSDLTVQRRISWPKL